jgi:hypothetical protein
MINMVHTIKYIVSQTVYSWNRNQPFFLGELTNFNKFANTQNTSIHHKNILTIAMPFISRNFEFPNPY